jgi:Zn-dependent protease
VQPNRAQIAGGERRAPITEPYRFGENGDTMHDQRGSETEGEYLPPESPPPPPRKGPGWKTAGGTLLGLALLGAKFKAVLFALLSLKWLLLAPKILISFGSLFVSLWFYALFFGWKFGLVFVLLLLVHELGHYLTFRNFGIPATLPFFIPGIGAFVARRGPAPSLTIDAIATLAGPVFGIGAAGVCYLYAVSTGQPFWYAAAYLGFFLNALNLLPLPPFDGGGIAAAIDPRLWILGAAGFLVWFLFFAPWSAFTLILLLAIGVTAIPRIMALRRGERDPRFFAMTVQERVAIAAAYFITVAIAAAGAVASHIDLPRHAGMPS